MNSSLAQHVDEVLRRYAFEPSAARSRTLRKSSRLLEISLSSDSTKRLDSDMRRASLLSNSMNRLTLEMRGASCLTPVTKKLCTSKNQTTRSESLDQPGQRKKNGAGNTTPSLTRRFL